ncbi:DUF4932 domain-containing protein [Clostridium perfringens]|uniref:DUF4932 domain-containing protein n=1 Tax=Clostridium perfringens TaxID=1502 RepID=UPI0024BCDF30|nr:DUF4932 domain-containing protein [Clostridium perfringens]
MRDLKIEVNKNLELMNIILLTIRYSEILSERFGFKVDFVDYSNEKYIRDIKDYFQKYSDHEIYIKLEEMIKDGFFLGRPMVFALALDNEEGADFKYEISEFNIKLSGGIKKLEEFRVLFNSFKEETKFDDFFSKVEVYYKDDLEYFNRILEKYNFINNLEEFSGNKNTNYNFVMSNLSKYNFGFDLNKDKEKYINIVFNLSIFLGDAIFIDNDYDICNLIFHELSHPVINPLTESNLALVNKYKEIHEELEKYKSEFSGYGDWEECVNEHIVRALSIHLSKKYFDIDFTNRRIEFDYNLGYRYIKEIVSKLEEYEKNRNRYKSIDEFYPELIKVFVI